MVLVALLGALVIVRWKNDDIAIDKSEGRTPLGANRPIEI